MTICYSIYLGDLVHNYVPGNYVVPYNVSQLRSYLLQEFNDLNIAIFKFPLDLLEAIKKNPPHILGLSLYSWNEELNRFIFEYVKKNHPDTVTIAGGVNFRSNNNNDLRLFLQRNNYIDYLIPFHGEWSLENIITFFREYGVKYKPFFTISGCAFLNNGKFFYKPIDVKSKNLNFPSSYLDGSLDPFLKEGLVPLIETNRGCPFSCTFCTWGHASQRNILKFPLDKVFAELEYLSVKFPDNKFWIFADANFGMLPRDILIAEKVAELAKEKKTPLSIIFWTSKGNPERTLAIAEKVKGLFRPLIAVQSFDEKVLASAKRTNIMNKNLMYILQKLKMNSDSEIATDLLLGLPNETKESHSESIRRAFLYGFDCIDITNIRLLPGSEYETEESRKEFGIRTKYRPISGAYGNYAGTTVIESEEVVIETNSITMENLLSFRPIHWLIWLLWNSQIAKPALKWYQEVFKDSPLTIIKKIFEMGKDSKKRRLSDMFMKFEKETFNEWFESKEELKQYYCSSQKSILKEGFSKMIFKYTSNIYLDEELKSELFRLFGDVLYEITRDNLSHLWQEICKKRIVRLNNDGKVCRSQKQEVKSIPAATISIISRYLNISINDQPANCYNLIFQGTDEQYNLIDYHLGRYSAYPLDKALEKALENEFEKYVLKHCVCIPES